MKRILGVIPARYASSRFPGKPLVDILGKSMIRRVYEQAKKCRTLTDVLVATDDERIFNHIKDFGGQVMMTSPNHPSGTDRIAEVAETKSDYQYYINIQGDEPFISPAQIELICNLLISSGAEIATLACACSDPEVLADPNTVKVVISKSGKALYFSRSVIPFCRNEASATRWPELHLYYRHIGIYGFSAEAIRKVSRLNQGQLEVCESLEQLRWLENDMEIMTAISNEISQSVDTPDDLRRLVALHQGQ